MYITLDTYTVLYVSYVSVKLDRKVGEAERVQRWLGGRSKNGTW